MGSRCAALLVFVVAACGRLHFDPLDDSGTGGDGGVTADAFAYTGPFHYLKASNAQAGDQFGASIAVSADGSTLAIGATGEASAATGVNGNQASNTAASSGAVYVFVRSGTTWVQQAYIKASNPDINDEFGSAVALSADGSTLAVSAWLEASASTGINGNQTDDSATQAGAVYVFARSGTTWAQQAYVKPSNMDAGDRFGNSIAVSGDGNTLAVGANDEASAATGVGGNQADNSLFGAGAVYVFTRTGAVWSQQAYVKASNTGFNAGFGGRVALSGDGTTLAVGAAGESSAATGVNGNQLDTSATNAGAAYVFTRAGATWSQQAYVKASNAQAGDGFGVSVSLSDDGNTLAVGALFESSAATGIDGNQADNSAANAGAVYVFARAAGSWSQRAYVKPSTVDAQDGFGNVVALSGDGDTLAVYDTDEASAATGFDGNQSDNSLGQAGAVFLFARLGGRWGQSHYVKATNTDANDGFGAGVGLSRDGRTLVVGALGESSAATGIDGNQADNSAMSAGAAFTYE